MIPTRAQLLRVTLTVMIAFVVAVPVGAFLGRQTTSALVLSEAPSQVHAIVNAETPLGEKSVHYRWYDMFNVSYGEHMYTRQAIYPNEQIVSDVYPNYLLVNGEPMGNTRYYTNMRLNVTARNLTEITMGGNPWFIPLMGTAGGGTAVLDWDLYYPTWDEVNATWGDPVSINYEGWLCTLRGDIILDRDAAMSVLNVTVGEFNAFEAWWAANNGTVRTNWLNWLVDQGRHAYDIWCAYEYPLTFLGFRMDGVKSGNQVILSFDSISWGIETLMTRWLRYSFMGTEWWFDDFHMYAVIQDSSTNLSIDTVVANAVFADTSHESGESCWVWHGMLADYLPSNPAHPDLPGDHVSDFDPYADDGYILLSPGSYYYDMFMLYDYTPGVQNLSSNDRLTFEWPAGIQMFKAHVSPGVVSDEYSHMTVIYPEPTVYDLPGQIVVDELGRTMTFHGPIDFWTWSRDQTNHAFLLEEWDRMGILPYGMPRMEFNMAPPLVADAGVNQTVLVGDVVTFDASATQSYFELVNFTWTFMFEGSPIELYGVQPTFQFTALGLYDVTLNVTDAVGRYDTDTVWILLVDLWIPELGGASVLLTVAVSLALILAVRHRRRS